MSKSYCHGKCLFFAVDGADIGIYMWEWVKKGYPKKPVRKNRPKPVVPVGLFLFDPKPCELKGMNLMIFFVNEPVNCLMDRGWFPHFEECGDVPL